MDMQQKTTLPLLSGSLKQSSGQNNLLWPSKNLLKKVHQEHNTNWLFATKMDMVERNLENAAKWFLDAVNGGQKQSLIALKRLAIEDVVNAQIGLAYLKFNGDNAVQKNKTEAIALLNKAHQHGSPIAMYNLGECYESGDGVEKNISRAIQFYTDAARNGITHAVQHLIQLAEDGVAEAQHHLGLCYENGYGVEQNVVDAAKWFFDAVKGGQKKSIVALERLAKENDPTTQTLLASYKLHGINGFTENKPEAFALFKKAAQHGEENAILSLGTL